MNEISTLKVGCWNKTGKYLNAEKISVKSYLMIKGCNNTLNVQLHLYFKSFLIVNSIQVIWIVYSIGLKWAFNWFELCIQSLSSITTSSFCGSKHTKYLTAFTYPISLHTHKSDPIFRQVRHLRQYSCSGRCTLGNNRVVVHGIVLRESCSTRDSVIFG